MKRFFKNYKNCNKSKIRVDSSGIWKLIKEPKHTSVFTDFDYTDKENMQNDCSTTNRENIINIYEPSADKIHISFENNSQVSSQGKTLVFTKR